MSTLTSNKKGDQFAFFLEDGLLDLFVGLGVAFAGLSILTGMIWMAGIFIPVFLPSIQAARKRLLAPRIGKMVQNSQQQAQTQRLLFSYTLLLGILFLAGIVLFLAFDFMSGPINNWLRQHFLLLLGTIFGSVWAFVGAMLKNKRFFLYGIMTFAALSTAQYTAVPFWLAMVALGILIAFVGLLILIRFLERYPKVK